MLNTENAVIEILPGKVDDSTAPGGISKPASAVWDCGRRAGA